MTLLAIGQGRPSQDWAQGRPVLWLDGDPMPADLSAPLMFRARRAEEYRTSAQSYLSAIEEANRLVLAWAQEARNAQGRSLNDLSDYRGCSLWSAGEVSLLYSGLADLIDQFRLWDHILETEAPASVWVGRHPDAALVTQLAHARGIQILGNQADEAWGYGPRQERSGTVRAWVRRWKFRGRSWRASWHNRRQPVVGAKQPAESLVLVLTLVKRFADIVIPVIRELERRPHTRVLVVDRNFTTACDRLREEGIHFLVWEAWGNASVERRWEAEAGRFATVWDALCKDEEFHRRFQYEGVPLWPFLKPRLHEDFLVLFPELARAMEITKALVESLRPDVVVLTDDRPPFQRVFVAECRNAGIPTVNIQNSILADVAEGGPITTDWIAVDGEASRANLITRGTQAEKIVVTGQPRFDFVPGKARRFDREETIRGSGFDPAKPLILLATQYVGIFMREEDKRRALRAVFTAVGRIPEVQLLVKLHPEDRDGTMERAAAAEAQLARVRFLSAGDIWPLIHASDLVIVFFSTVGYEAIVLDKPVLQIHLDGPEAEPYRFTDEGAALGVEKLEDMEGAIRAALFDPSARARLQEGRRAYLRAHVHALDGRSAHRVADLIGRVADANKAGGRT